MQRNRFIGLLMAYAPEFFLEDDEGKWEKIEVNVQEYLTLGDAAFRLHFRFSKPVFTELSRELSDLLHNNGTIQRESATPFEHILMMVIWIMATPDSFRSVALRFGKHPSVVHTWYVTIIRGLCILGENYIRWPTQEERNQIKRRVERRTTFPGVVGMMDGKHFLISQPIEDAASYRNYHHGYSVKVQAVCDDQTIVRDLYVGEAGSLHDRRVFRRSPLRTNLLFRRNMFGDGEHIIADSAYPLEEHILTPFIRNHRLTPMQRNYNRKLSSGRVRVEHLFGEVSIMWRRCMHLQVKDLEYASEHIGASFVLHNYRLLHGVRLPNAAPCPEDDQNIDDPLPVMDYEVHPNDDDDDPLVPHGEAAQLERDAQLLGEQKRLNMCNELPQD